MSTTCCSNSRWNRRDWYSVPGPVNLNRFSAIYDLVARPDLKYTPFTPGLAEGFSGAHDLSMPSAKRDVLLHHPFQASRRLMDLLRRPAGRSDGAGDQARRLYRTGDRSPIVDALVAAAQAGKDVTVIIELRARFDEEANIELSDAPAGSRGARDVRRGGLQDARQAHAHSCARRGRRHPPLLHLGTGNYHPGGTRAATPTTACSPAKAIRHRLARDLWILPA